MEVLVYVLGALGVLGLVKYMLQRAKVDAVISELSRPSRVEEVKEIATLTEQVKQAKIAYSDAKREYEAPPSEYETKQYQIADIQEIVPVPEPVREAPVLPATIKDLSASGTSFVEKITKMMFDTTPTEIEEQDEKPVHTTQHTGGVELNHFLNGNRSGDVQRPPKR